MSDYSYIALTEEDRKAIKAENSSGFQDLIWYLIVILVIMPTLFIFMFDYDFEDFVKYEMIAVPICALFFAIFTWFGDKFKKDLQEGVKLSGTTVLLDKTKVYTRVGKVYRIFEFDLDGKREIHVDSSTYALFSENETIYVEMAKHSSHVLKISKVI